MRHYGRTYSTVPSAMRPRSSSTPSGSSRAQRSRREASGEDQEVRACSLAESTSYWMSIRRQAAGGCLPRRRTFTPRLSFRAQITCSFTRWSGEGEPRRRSASAPGDELLGQLRRSTSEVAPRAVDGADEAVLIAVGMKCRECLSPSHGTAKTILNSNPEPNAQKGDFVAGPPC